MYDISITICGIVYDTVLINVERAVDYTYLSFRRIDSLFFPSGSTVTSLLLICGYSPRLHRHLLFLVYPDLSSFNGGNSENFNASVAKIAASSNALEFIPLDSSQNGDVLVSGFGSTYNSAILIISNDENSTTAAYAITVAQLASTTTTTTTSTTSTTSTTTSTSTTISGGLEATSTEASMGETITINVTVSNAPNDVESLGFDLTYDGNALQYNSYVNGSLVEGFDFFGVNNISSEAVRVGAFTTQNTIQAGESGSIVEFTFTVIGCYNSQLVLENLADNVSSWAVSPGESTCPGATTTTTTTTTSTSTIMDCLKGDSDCNGTVSDFELLNYIDLWVNGQVGDFDVLEAIDNWTSG
ncbi:MAG: cohesin domain-containing protein [Candidatus Altiarchaeota archaeon]|nr:cohesin domain-containing protein [Candidatus Altiarchaeota archaeon]